MNKHPFRHHHLLQLLNEWDDSEKPLDRLMNDYFRGHKALGSKDRAFIAETAYSMVRQKGLLDNITPKPADWEGRLRTFFSQDLTEKEKDPTLPAHIALSFPKALYDLIVQNYGEEKGACICRVSNQPAPLTIRANTLKTTRDELFAKLQGQFEVFPCNESPDGIQFHKKAAVFSLPEFQAGLFEVQDEASQLVASLVKAVPGDQVLDFCSGSGGKALAIAPKLLHKGQLFLHDIRPYILTEARRRLKRAGVQNGQTLLPDSKVLRHLKKHCDWVLVDAPCSGTGTLRRNPDMKWRFTPEMLSRLISEQRVIFEKALSFMKPKGHIVYSTCSILTEENQQQMDHFIKTYNLKLVGEVFQTFPTPNGMDGFFGCVLCKNDLN